MLKNYFKIALRNLQRNKTYAALNILGLSVGIAASLLIFVVIRFQTSFDNFHTKKDQIYRVGSQFHTQDGVDYSDGVSFPTGPALRIDFPQIKEVASIYRDGGQITLEEKDKQQKRLREDNFYYAEPEFFKMFDFGWLSGDATTCLKNPNDAVLTQEIAEKYFGSWRSAIGKTFKYENIHLYTVKGILKNIPPNSDFPLGVVVP